MCFEVFGTQPQATVPELLEAIANLRSHTVEACCDAKQIRDATMPVTESPAALGQQHRPHIEGPPLGIAMITQLKTSEASLKLPGPHQPFIDLHTISYIPCFGPPLGSAAGGQQTRGGLGWNLFLKVWHWKPQAAS